MTNALGSLQAAAANTYSDLNGLNALKTGGTSPQTLHAVAQQVDAMFLQMMLKSMRDAGADAGDPESNAMGMYEDMFDKQVSLTLSQHQDIGLGSVLTRQLGGSSTATPAVPAVGTAGSGTTATPAMLPARSPALVRPVSDEDAGAGGVGASPSDFVSQVMPAIRTAAAALGVSPLGILAQAALETGWGRRMPRTANGASSLNLFGIKAGGEWDGDKASATTVEFSDGVATPKRGAFRAYDSIEHSVSDFAKLMSSPRYRAAITAGKTALGYVQGIANSGYATDPQYAAKLMAMLQSGTFRQALSNSGMPL